ncbi:MAG: Ldh family oxidoreductase [Haloferacaceae archaeon]
MRIEAERLEAAAGALLETTGAPPATADAVAESLVESDLRGHHSHGVLRVPYYADMIEAGSIDPAAKPAVDRSTGTLVKLDGCHAFGQVVGREAVDLLTDRVAAEGIAAVGMRDATHLGRVGEWAERTAAAGYCFAAFVNSQGGGHNVAPAGSADRLLSTNPMAYGIPTMGALDHDVVLDMATSQVAHGKIRELEASGGSVPEGWTTDERGAGYTDAAGFEAGEGGAMLPLGGRTAGYKGTGLAVVSELFAGLLGDGFVAGGRDAEYSSNAAVFVAVDPLFFTDREGIRRRMTTLADHLAAADYDAGPSPGVAAKGDRFRMPGAPEHERREAHLAEGVEIDDAVADRLRAMAEARDVDVDL